MGQSPPIEVAGGVVDLVALAANELSPDVYGCTAKKNGTGLMFVELSNPVPDRKRARIWANQNNTLGACVAICPQWINNSQFLIDCFTVAQGLTDLSFTPANYLIVFGVSVIPE